MFQRRFLSVFVSFFTVLSFSKLQAAEKVLLDVHLDLHDVSVLLPLPPVDQLDLSPTPRTQAQFGELLPKSKYDMLPPILVENSEITWPRIRLVGFRVDPCFFEGATPLKCRPQVRMVWQPLVVRQFEREGVVQSYVAAQDAAIHSFYELNAEEFEVLLGKLISMKKKLGQAKDRPLLVHPTLAKEGLAGAYFKELWNVILAFTGENRLSRITFMQLSAAENMWTFGGFEVDAGKMIAMIVPRTRVTTQAFVNNTFPRPFWFKGGILPEPKEGDNFNILTRDSRKLTEQNEQEIIDAVGSAIRLENPNKHNAGTADCVSCHVAQPARIWSMRQYPWLMLDQVHHSEFYKFNRDLSNISPMQPHTNVVRAFGYFENRPIVSQRTINESAMVIDYLEKNFTNESH